MMMMGQSIVLQALQKNAVHQKIVSVLLAPLRESMTQRLQEVSKSNLMRYPLPSVTSGGINAHLARRAKTLLVGASYRQLTSVLSERVRAPYHRSLYDDDDAESDSDDLVFLSQNTTPFGSGRASSSKPESVQIKGCTAKEKEMVPGKETQRTAKQVTKDARADRDSEVVLGRRD
ncbi:MAG: hypothetical protein ASARMPRED_004659 [Alectoria sarmentosa]|nr:MAG: hypothetical protein ASARMPRED_004659 [Alectoria sarmentosa]